MNVLYLGPYRQNDYMGQYSRMNLRSIISGLPAKKSSVYSRPIYIDFSSIDQNVPEDISNAEIFPKDNIQWSGIIQNLPIEFLTVQKFTKNIAIPILNNKLEKSSLNNIHFYKLNSFDHILLDSENNKNLLLKSGITTKISIYNEDFKTEYLDTEIINKQFDLGIINEKFVFSFIGSYISNVQIIHKIIIAFLIAFRSDADNMLFFLLKGTAKDKEELIAFYEQTKKQLNIIGEDKVVFSFGSLTITEALAAINTCSCYLSLNDDISLTIYEKYCNSVSKPIISKHSLESISSIPLSIGEFYDLDDLIGSVVTMSLSEKLKNIKQHQSLKKNKSNNKTLTETICNILQ